MCVCVCWWVWEFCILIWLSPAHNMRKLINFNVSFKHRKIIISSGLCMRPRVHATFQLFVNSRFCWNPVGNEKERNSLTNCSKEELWIQCLDIFEKYLRMWTAWTGSHVSFTIHPWIEWNTDLEWILSWIPSTYFDEKRNDTHIGWINF